MEDENAIDSFDLLFKALSYATIKQDKEMLRILASTVSIGKDYVKKDSNSFTYGV